MNPTITMPGETIPAVPKTPSPLGHLLNIAVIMLLLVDMWMVGALMEEEYERIWIWKTSTIKGDGPMGPNEAFWYWVDNWLVGWLIMIVPSNLALAFVHVPRIFKKPSLLNDVALALESFALLAIFTVAIFPYSRHFRI